MALKIHEMTSDERGRIRAEGLFDGERFSLSNDGASWILDMASHPPVNVHSHNPASRSEANGLIWAAVARVREAQKNLLMA